MNKTNVKVKVVKVKDVEEQHVDEIYVDLKEDVRILPDIIPDDSLYDDRDFSDKDRENRLSKLIFGSNFTY
jgi:hypothetical protein